MIDPEDILRAPTTSATNDELRARIFAQTRGTLRGRRVRRRIAQTGVVAITFVAGFVVSWFTRSPEIREVTIEKTTIIEVPATESIVELAPLPRQVVPPAITAAEAELRAEQERNPAACARLFQTAGNLYLVQERNLTAAVRCYGYFLDFAAPDQLELYPEDTWLLTSLKNDRRKEKNHANPDQ